MICLTYGELKSFRATLQYIRQTHTDAEALEKAYYHLFVLKHKCMVYYTKSGYMFAAKWRQRKDGRPAWLFKIMLLNNPLEMAELVS